LPGAVDCIDRGLEVGPQRVLDGAGERQRSRRILPPGLQRARLVQAALRDAGCGERTRACDQRFTLRLRDAARRVERSFDALDGGLHAGLQRLALGARHRVVERAELAPGGLKFGSAVPSAAPGARAAPAASGLRLRVPRRRVQKAGSVSPGSANRFERSAAVRACRFASRASRCACACAATGGRIQRGIEALPKRAIGRRRRGGQLLPAGAHLLISCCRAGASSARPPRGRAGIGGGERFGLGDEFVARPSAAPVLPGSESRCLGMQ
jgi:hypothetical protein